MASPNLYLSGIGGSRGDELATADRYYTSGYVWYVNSAIGVDAAGTVGRERQKPLATIAQAYTNASAGDTISIAESHTETLTAVLTVAKAGLVLVGEGVGIVNMPRFTRNYDGKVFDITAAGVELRNLYFPQSTTASTSSRVRTAASATLVRGCWFDCGANDTGPALETITGAGPARIENDTFASTATALTAQPHSAIKVTNAISDLYMADVLIDGGTVGWSNRYAFNGTAAITRLHAIRMSLLNNSDVLFATGTSGLWVPLDSSGSAQLEWTA